MPTLPFPLRLLGQALMGLLAVQSCCFAGVQAAVVEVDLVFPRNETYSTGPIPLLFAVQNSALAVPLAMSISWVIRDLDSGQRMATGSRTLHCDELGQTDPLLTHEYLDADKTTAAEATWFLIWNVQSQNCSREGNDTQISQILQQQKLRFTTKKGAPQPDLLQSTDACTRSQAATFNVTDTLPIEPSLNMGRGLCNVLAPGPFPPAHPCAIAMGPKVAAAAVNLTRQSFCESVTPPKSTSTPSSGNAAARGAPLWTADAGSVMWLTSLMSAVSMVAGLY
ncbi:hypothetical protein NEMBOFW57_006178 [Staphylotrichum longicolle]|uniref:DUF7136 domain-containing protein n=1 Tax=Staphylotrichum longicolle TaxID=669026 RepID=A0AAD4HZ79_9PEZI|nr:hypothetical protein NEMBOFW57_006178 [Staphylotrichum longicolle]